MKTLKILSDAINKWHINRNNQKIYQPPESKKKWKQNKQDDIPLWFSFVCKIHTPIMLLITIISLSSVISYRFYNQPELAVGTISPTRIEAPADKTFEDKKTTEEERKKIRNGISPFLQENKIATNEINLGLTKKIQEINNLRKTFQLPYISTNLITIETQKYLRQCSQNEWQEILAHLNKQSSSELSPQQKKAFQELKLISNQEKKETITNLINQIINVRQQYKQTEIDLEIGRILTPAEKETLIEISEDTWKTTQNNIITAKNKIIVQGIPVGLPDEIKQKTALIHLENSIPEKTKSIAVKILFNSLIPNLEINELETKKRAEKAAKEVDNVYISVKKQDVIVDIGQKITQSQFVILDGFNLSRRGVNWTGVAISIILVTTSIFVFMFISKQINKKLRRRDQILLWLLSVTIPICAVTNAHYTSLPAVGFLVSSFYGTTLALSNVTLMTGLVLFQTQGANWEYIIASYGGSLLASFLASKLHSREELALLGGGVGLTQGAIYLIINLISSAAAGTIWYIVLPGALGYGLIGVAYIIIALGLSPYLERFFDLITPIRLAELSNPNRHLLKRLSIEAPGTFAHTMFVASLAEAAARELNCNVELVRAGTLYHDIGKMHDPQAFIENQMDGINKHDQINDPFVSAKIIKKHVSEGLVIARKYGLPKAIRDFIPEHQGTILISYFYFQAKNKADIHHIDIDETIFHYDGPIPQSRETGIVMLADACEAALRSLKDATLDQAISMVQKILKARWRENELVESGLKYDELPIIAKIFVQVWQQSNHKRIVYPKAALDATLLTVRSRTN